MKVLFVVINDLDVFDELVVELVDHGISGGTIFETQGMMTNIAGRNAVAHLYQNLNKILAPGQDFNKTLMMVLDDEQVGIAKACVRQVAGSFDNPNSGLMFTLDADSVEGYGHKE